MIENYFENIDTEAKAYFLGLIFADGHVCVYTAKDTRNNKNYNYQRVNFSLSSNDLHILETFKKFIKSDHKIRVRPAGTAMVMGRKVNCKASYRIDIKNKILFQNLVDHGCVPRKSLILEFPTSVPEHLIRHFIRGYFDGDGNVNKFKSEKYRYKNPQFKWSIVGTKNMCENINTIFSKNLDFPPNKIIERIDYKHPKNKNIFIYQVTGNLKSKLIYLYLYSNSSPELCLYRKKKYFNEILELKEYRKPPIRDQIFVNKISSISESFPF